ncbi:patatin-like phospholipase family protein [Chitinimonas sp. BJYL2]|uniref:patatin-like phospholipase family protein n=1 Tax=Chitinimonas sp. BJYL2 TaxID=2976696 RepID=UPI0022B4D356|nr:patatin-like phospholipase family protein [Chitinimonas sp. BJYL2]
MSVALPLQAAPPERPKVALVLGGGGARGLAHVGVLKVLEAARIPVDCVVGTSMGALVGGLYAGGRSAAEVEAAVRAIHWDEVLDDRPRRPQRTFKDKQDDWLGMMNLGLGLSDRGEMLFPKGAIGTQKVDLLIRRLVNNAALPSFDQLAIPYRAVAADLETGDMVVLSRGDLAAAMRASMAVPGVFPPVERDTRMLVDGGIARNLPVDVARGLCGERVIAIDVGSPLLSRKEVTDALAVSDQTLRVLTQRNVDEQIAQLGKRDLLIRPELGALSGTEFNAAETAIAAGELAAREALPQLLALQVEPAAFANWREQTAARAFVPPKVKSVTVDATRFVSPDVLKDTLAVPAGEPLDVPALHASLGRAYARGDFDQIDYRLIPDGDGANLLILPREKSWGPGYLDLGLGLRTDFEDDAAFLLSAQYRRTWLNKLGGEWKTRAWLGKARGLSTAFYQPLRPDDGGFVALEGSINNDAFPIYLAGERVADYRLVRRNVNIDAGLNVGRSAQLRIGLEKSRVRASRSTGDPAFPDLATTQGGVRLKFAIDQLDSAQYPREGYFAGLNAYRNLASMGRDEDFSTANLTLKQALRVGAWAGLIDLRYDWSNDADIDSLPTAGGLFRLSSYGVDAIRAKRIARAQLRLSQDVTRLAPLLGTAGFWGVSLETARTWGGIDASYREDKLRYAGVLFVGSDTRLGPAYFGYAYGDNRHGRVYLSINGDF